MGQPLIGHTTRAQLIAAVAETSKPDRLLLKTFRVDNVAIAANLRTKQLRVLLIAEHGEVTALTDDGRPAIVHLSGLVFGILHGDFVEI